ncbi:hypothetical protein [Bacillus wiedmannii]|uniref:hypothetical protein n=2 Tax=Bacillus wiedmannii TaxID=1890302 RepID=UPI003D191F4A
MNKELTMLRTNETISPHFLYRKTKINVNIINDFLIDLSFECPFLGTKYIILCDNKDSDMVHAFDFNTLKEMKEFIVESGKKCPECESNLNLNQKDIRVRFYKKKVNDKVMQVNIYG